MKQEQKIDELIAKEEKKNIYLSELLRNLEERLSKGKSLEETPENSIEMRSEVQMAQVKNLNKRIEQYEKDIEKMKHSNNKTLFDDIGRLRVDIDNKEEQLKAITSEVESLQGEVDSYRIRSHGKNKNKEIETLFNEKHYEMKSLKKKLELLENVESNRMYKPPPARRNVRSYSSNIKEPDLPKVEETDKKSKIDKFAMFKNLIRFYSLEEEKLKGEILALQAEKGKRDAQTEKIRKEIEEYQAKIQQIRKARQQKSPK